MEQDLQRLFSEELADLYDAEQQILKALPKLAKAVSSPELREALDQHRLVTEGQVRRLEEIFDQLGEKPKKKCKAMAGLLAEGDELLSEDYAPAVKDAGIIGSAQRVEHYEIAAYGTARTFALRLGNARAAELLEETLNEEKDADRELTEIAESTVNVDAVAQAGREGVEAEEGEENEGGEEEGTSRSRSARREKVASAASRSQDSSSGKGKTSRNRSANAKRKKR